MVQEELCPIDIDTKPLELGKDTQRLWIIEFDITNNGRGCAVVKAENSKKAALILKAEGTFNGLPHMYKITRVEEILPSPKSMLLAEQITGLYEN